jgi:hypothetical protein
MTGSLQYRFPYLIRSGADFPRDFRPCSETTFFPGLFLPGDDPDWFGRSVNPPRIILLSGDRVEVHFHPEANKATVLLPTSPRLSIQTGRALLVGWIGFASSDVNISLGYNRRVDEPVGLFLAALRSRLLPRGSGDSIDPIVLGDDVDLKLQNALQDEIEPDETEQVRFVIAPNERRDPHGFLRRIRSTPGEALVLTNRRLIWITESCRGWRDRYRTMISYAHPDNVGLVVVNSENRMDRLVVNLRNSKVWSIHIPAHLSSDARKFAARVRDLEDRNYFGPARESGSAGVLSRDIR